MIELYYDAIKITAGDNTLIEAIVKDKDDEPIVTGDMHFVISDAYLDIPGVYDNEKECWVFDVPKSAFKGRYFYHFELDGTYLDFKAPIYFA